MDVMPFDELNIVKAALPQFFNEDGRGIKSKADYDSMLDMLEDLFFLAYSNGVQSTNLALSSNVEPTLNEVLDVVDKEIVGKTWRDRVREYYENGGTVDDIVRIAETETHRDANAGAYNAAKAAGATEKVWHCMMIPTSRDTHVYLNGVSAPIDGEFYSFMGGSTKYPGEWGIAEEDCNCLCWLTYQ